MGHKDTAEQDIFFSFLFHFPKNILSLFLLYFYLQQVGGGDIIKSWKELEYKVAKILGGKRIPASGNAEGFKGDVEHDKFFIECKWGKQIPKRIQDWFNKTEQQAKKEGKIPLLIMKAKGKHGEFVFLRLSDFAKILKGGIK